MVLGRHLEKLTECGLGGLGIAERVAAHTEHEVGVHLVGIDLGGDLENRSRDLELVDVEETLRVAHHLGRRLRVRRGQAARRGRDALRIADPQQGVVERPLGVEP